MRSAKAVILIILIILTYSCGNRSSDGKRDSISMISFSDKERIDLNINGKLFTSFCWPDSVNKPMLSPVMTASGTDLSSAFPLKNDVGELVSNTHQSEIWLAYGKVNGYDFWNNISEGLTGTKIGIIKHIGTERLSSKNGTGLLVSLDEWLDPRGKKLLDERTEYNFISRGDIRIIDRITTLTAGDSLVKFSDTKDGLFTISVSAKPDLTKYVWVVVADSSGNALTVSDSMSTVVEGNYRNSENITGDAVWGTRAKWIELSGIAGTERISVIICDHPKNHGYPTYWHASGSGLFSANPIGRKDFTDGKETSSLSIPAKKSLKLRYRVIINSGNPMTDSQINALSDEFSKKYKKN